jgi:hypothetical protein
MCVTRMLQLWHYRGARDGGGKAGGGSDLVVFVAFWFCVNLAVMGAVKFRVDCTRQGAVGENL